MKKVKSKIVGIILTLTMVIGLMPQINTFAEGNTYSIDFSEATSIEGNTATYHVGDVDVTLTSSQDISADKKAMLGDNDELTLGDSFEADKMEVAVKRKSDNWEKVLVVDSNRKTRLSSGDGALNPDDDWLIIIRTKNNNDGPKPPQEGPGQQTFKAKLGEGLAVDGIGKDESGIYELLEDTIIRITKEDFNSETMVIRVKSDDGFETTLRVNDDRTTSISNKTNDGGIPEPFTIEIVNRSELDPEGPEGQGPDDGNNPPQGDLDRVQADKGQIAINIKNSFCGNVEYSLGDGSGWKEFRGGFLDLTDIDSGTTIKFKAYISGDVKADIKGDETIIDIDGKIDPINKDDLRNGVFSFDFDSAKAYTIDIVFDYFGENTGSDFDGTAYIIWKGSKNQTCFYRFENLDPREDNFVNVKDIVDQSVSGSTEKFTLDAEYEWVRKEVFEENWDKEDSILKSWFASEIDEDTLHSFTMDPTTSKRGANSIFNTPDRKFRIGLITDAYQAIVIDAESMVYPECPYNDNVFGVPYVDISETEEEFFAICEVYLDEPVITLGADEISNGLKSVKAINAMDTAVKVTDKGDGVFSVEFKSNYYDRVIFEITDVEGGTYYLMLARIAISVGDNFGPETKQEDEALIVDYIYDESKSYKDFQVVVTLVDRDGNQTVELLNPVIVTDQNGSTEQYEVPAGQGLKLCQFNVKCDGDKEIAYFTIIKTGSLSGDSFTGAVSGSGEGIMYDIKEREIIY